MSTHKKKFCSVFGNLFALIWGLLPIALVLFTFLNLRLYKMTDESMAPALEKSDYILSIRKDVKNLEKGTLVYIDADEKKERSVRKFNSLDGNYAYVTDVNGENGEWVSVDNIWGTILFQIG